VEAYYRNTLDYIRYKKAQANSASELFAAIEV